MVIFQHTLGFWLKHRCHATNLNDGRRLRPEPRAAGARLGRDRGRARPRGWQGLAALRNWQLRMTRGTVRSQRTRKRRRCPWPSHGQDCRTGRGEPRSRAMSPQPESLACASECPGRAAMRGDGQQAHLRRRDTCALVKVTGQSWGGQRVPRSLYSWPQAFQRAPSCCWSGQGPDPFRLQWISELQGGKSKSLRL